MFNEDLYKSSNLKSLYLNLTDKGGINREDERVDTETTLGGANREREPPPRELNPTDLTNINLNRFMYTRPNFVAFVEDLIPRDGKTKMKYEAPYPEWLTYIVRGILDSKFYEHWLQDRHPQGITRISEFAFAFLNNFTVD